MTKNKPTKREELQKIVLRRRERRAHVNTRAFFWFPFVGSAYYKVSGGLDKIRAGLIFFGPSIMQPPTPHLTFSSAYTAFGPTVLTAATINQLPPKIVFYACPHFFFVFFPLHLCIMTGTGVPMGNLHKNWVRTTVICRPRFQLFG